LEVGGIPILTCRVSSIIVGKVTGQDYKSKQYHTPGEITEINATTFKSIKDKRLRSLLYFHGIYQSGKPRQILKDGGTLPKTQPMISLNYSYCSICVLLTRAT
jgi:hypothetical protein